MITFQDLQAVGENERARMDFVHSAIAKHKASDEYREAVVAKDYERHRNRTIYDYQKLLYTVTGKAVVDNFSANWKMASNFFHRFIVQETQYLLGNGVTWKDDKTRNKVGKDFDTKLQKLAKAALVQGVSFGFFNLDHLEVFELVEFAPLYDEENGALMAGVRFWQVADNKPLRATLYEIDGYTEYLWKDGEGQILKEKRPYILKTRTTQADGTEIYDGDNYPSFPIVPLWANPDKQSELVGIREQIDCYDIIKSGYANDVDDASQIYWVIQNAGGMDDVDLAKFIERLKTVKAAAVDDNGARAEAHTVEVPYAGREAILAKLERDLYKNAMALDPETIAGGAITATQIKAAYEPLNSKCDEFEYCVHDFMDGLIIIAGLEGEEPTFSRSIVINKAEEIQTVLQSAQFLSSEYVTRKILATLGDGDLADDMLVKMDKENQERMTQMQNMAAAQNGNEPPEGEEDDEGPAETNENEA